MLVPKKLFPNKDVDQRRKSFAVLKKGNGAKVVYEQKANLSGRPTRGKLDI